MPRPEVETAVWIAGDIVISKWVRASGLESRSGWVVIWLDSRFEEGPPDLSRWLAMLRPQESVGRMFERGADPSEMGYFFPYQMPTSKAQFQRTLKSFRMTLTASYQSFLDWKSVPSPPKVPPSRRRKSGKYQVRHYLWLALSVCQVQGSRIAKKHKVGPSTVFSGTRSAAERVDIRLLTRFRNSLSKSPKKPAC